MQKNVTYNCLQGKVLATFLRMRFGTEKWNWRTEVPKMRGEKGKARVEMNERKKMKRGTGRWAYRIA